MITSKLELDPDSRYIINVGSLGQPRDGNPDPVFVFYDSVSHIVEFFRFSYDLFSTQQKIIACGLPYIASRSLEKWFITPIKSNIKVVDLLFLKVIAFNNYQ